MVTFEEMKKAIKNGDTIYAVDCMGVDTIDLGNKKIDYAYDEATLCKIDKEARYVLEFFSLEDLYKTCEEAKTAFEELGL